MSIKQAELDLARARGDAERLAVQLKAAESRILKLENYLELARLYEERAEPPDGAVSASGPAIVQAAISILQERKTRQKTSALVEELERRGQRIGGTNKITNLSGSLSRSPLLTASRTEGWGLKEWADGASATLR